MVDENNIAEIRCDLTVTRPDGTISLRIEDHTCFKGPLVGDPFALRLSDALLGFIGEENDLLGEWVTEVTLRDVNREKSLGLRTRFELVEETSEHR